MSKSKRPRSLSRRAAQRVRRLSHRYPVVRPALRALRRVLQLDDTPESIARGVALGLFVAFTPTVGIQMVLVLIVNTVFRANRLAGVAMVWLTNPVTVVPVYWWNYMVGAWTLGQTPIGFDRFARLFDLQAQGLFEQFLEFLERLGDLGLAVALPLTLGGVITGLVLGVLSYPLTLALIRKEREALERLKRLRQQRRLRHLARLASTHAAHTAPRKEQGALQHETVPNAEHSAAHAASESMPQGRAAALERDLESEEPRQRGLERPRVHRPKLTEGE